MQAGFEISEGLRRLNAIIASFPSDSPHWNEAQNRFQFVDRLLREVLGWEAPHIEIEHFDEAGRSDYLLGKPAKAVLEAKRETVRFDFPPHGSPSMARKLSSLIASSKNFQDALKQILPYCAMNGAQVAIICNGPQMAVFQSMIPGLSPLEGDCYVFDGFDKYVEYFPILWGILSPEGITENRAYRDLSLHRNRRLPPKISHIIPDATRFRYRRPIQENLRTLSSILLEDVLDDTASKPQFYRECYVPMEANSRHLLLSKNIIQSRYKRADPFGAIPEPIDLGTKKSTDRYVNLGGDAANPISGRPLVILGDVGVGKTSFFENLYYSLDKKDHENTLFLYINLGEKAALAESVKSYVLHQIPNTLLEKYNIDVDSYDFCRSIYHNDIQRFDKSPSGTLKNLDPQAYERARIEYIIEKQKQRDVHLHVALGHLNKGRNKNIILVIDNADQRSFETQQEAFLIAQELAATKNLLVFISLRPSTFFRSKSKGALSGYQNKVLTIAPPPAEVVLEKRIVFALRVAEGSIRSDILQNIRLNIESIKFFLQATLRSIKANSAIRQFLGNITGGNTRIIIELISGFCGSPNVDSEKIIKIEESTGAYRVPLHEFTKHALLGDYAYFNPDSSQVACNVFDLFTSDSREHFLEALIIAYVASAPGMKDNDGFLTGDAVTKEMHSCGFIEEQTHLHLRRLASKRLLETPHSHFRELDADEKANISALLFRSTSIGVYHLRHWIGNFSFLDAVCIDTPIFDEDTRKTISSNARSFAIEDRYVRASAFRQYLETQWYTSNFTVNYLDFPDLLKRQQESFDDVRRAFPAEQGAYHSGRAAN